MNFLLIAVITTTTGSFFNTVSEPLSFQTSTMQRFDTLEDCKPAANQLQETHLAGNYKGQSPDRGQIRCVNLKTKEVTIVVEAR